MAAIVVLALVSIFVVAMIDHAKKQQLASAVTGPIAYAQDGAYVRIVGTIAPFHTLRAPITGTPCVAYTALASIRNRKVKKKMIISFGIVDATGHAVVDIGNDPKMLDAFELGWKYQQRASTVSLGRDRYPGLAELAVDWANAVYEGRLAPGDRVAVFGQLKRDFVDYGDGRGPQPFVRLLRPAGKPFVVTDAAKWLPI